MQPLGRRPVRFPGKQDCHPKKPLVNRWEAEIASDENTPAARQQARRDIVTELQVSLAAKEGIA